MFYVYLSNVDIFILTESNAVTKSPMGILFGNDVCVCVCVYVCVFLKDVPDFLFNLWVSFFHSCNLNCA